MPTQYKSWVPTVVARLSFSTAGRTSYPSPSVSANEADANIRYLVCDQERDTLDVILPFKHFFARKFLKLEGQMWCVCVARTRDHEGKKLEKLEGRIFLFDRKSDWVNKARRLTLHVQSTLRQVISYCPYNQLESFFQGTYDFLHNELSKSSTFNVKFTLLRNGEVIFICEDSEICNQKKFSRIRNGGNCGERQSTNVMSQIFFFLRDVTHTHQHHNPRTDTIIDLHVADDDFKWRAQILYALYRKIISFKRTKTPDAVVASLGTLAYAQAFKGICELELKKGKDVLPRYDDNSLRASLDAARVELSLREERAAHRRYVFLSALLGTFGAIFTLASLLNLTKTSISGTPDKILISLGEVLVNHTLYSVTLIASVIFVLNRPTSNISILRNITRILQPLQRSITLIVLVSVAALIGFSTIYFVFS